MVEGVLIPSGGRFTACVSSQVGCPLGCLFLRDRQNWVLKRNLSAGEIFDQAAYLNSLALKTNEESGRPVKHSLHGNGGAIAQL